MTLLSLGAFAASFLIIAAPVVPVIFRILGRANHVMIPDRADSRGSVYRVLYSVAYESFGIALFLLGASSAKLISVRWLPLLTSLIFVFILASSGFGLAGYIFYTRNRNRSF